MRRSAGRPAGGVTNPVAAAAAAAIATDLQISRLAAGPADRPGVRATAAPPPRGGGIGKQCLSCLANRRSELCAGDPLFYTRVVTSTPGGCQPATDVSDRCLSSMSRYQLKYFNVLLRGINCFLMQRFVLLARVIGSGVLYTAVEVMSCLKQALNTAYGPWRFSASVFSQMMKLTDTK